MAASAISDWQARGCLVVDIRPSAAFEEGHIAGAIWSIRPELDAVVEPGRDVLLIASDPAELIKAWQALEAWCAACGLALNLDKTGAIAIRGSLPAELPQAPPRWLFVTIDQSGAGTMPTKGRAALPSRMPMMIGWVNSRLSKRSGEVPRPSASRVAAVMVTGRCTASSRPSGTAPASP